MRKQVESVAAEGARRATGVLPLRRSITRLQGRSADLTHYNLERTEWMLRLLYSNR